ncbi:MAG: beta-glucosidase BglX [Calditrichia bacterium]|nr:beta-glucosidase BglX [Calditrichia bacterium]
MQELINRLLSHMTLEEKLGQLAQYRWSWRDDTVKEQYRQYIREGRVGSFLGIAGVGHTRELQRLAVEESRLKIPLLFAEDVIHGWRTTFPVPLAEAGSWDPAAVERSARIAAIEASAMGLHWTFAPMVDIARDPRWGRIVEGSGEDPYLGSVMAAARVRGFSRGGDLSAPNTLLACAKHFAAYGGAEGGRDYNTVELSERTLREIYLEPFRAAVQAGAGSIMSAFNEVNGVPMTANGWMINDILRGEWGFTGLVVSDYTAVAELQPHGVAANRAEAGVLALAAGVDIDMVSGIYGNDLEELVRQGKLDEALVDQAVRRVLEAKYRLGLFDDPYRYHDAEREKTSLLTPEHLAAAREMARKSIVLLKNEKEILPLSKNLKTLAVIGALADDRRSSLGPWSGAGDTADVVTLLEGIERALPASAKILYAEGYDKKTFTDRGGFARAIQAAKSAEAVILVLGETAGMSGEASNRASLDLPGEQEALARAIHAVGKPLVVVLMNGRPLSINWLVEGSFGAENVPAILETWFLGVQTGPAAADVLFGDYNPGGKLPATFPRSAGQIPIYYNHKNTGRPPIAGEHYTSQYLDLPFTPLYPFGYGLSYTTFEYGAPRLSVPEMEFIDTLTVEVNVTNTGKRPGDEVVQFYIQDEVASVTRPVKQLRGFRRIHLEPGETQTVTFQLTFEDLAFYNQEMQWVVEPGFFKVFLGGNSVEVQEARFEIRSGKL